MGRLAQTLGVAITNLSSPTVNANGNSEWTQELVLAAEKTNVASVALGLA